MSNSEARRKRPLMKKKMNESTNQDAPSSSSLSKLPLPKETKMSNSEARRKRPLMKKKMNESTNQDAPSSSSLSKLPLPKETKMSNSEAKRKRPLMKKKMNESTNQDAPSSSSLSKLPLPKETNIPSSKVRVPTSNSKKRKSDLSRSQNAVSGPSHRLPKKSDLKRTIQPVRCLSTITEEIAEDDDINEDQHEVSTDLDIPKEPQLPQELLQTFYKTPGVLMIAGLVSWDLVAKRESNPLKKTHPDLFTFHKFTDVKYRLIISGCSAGHSILVSAEGDALTFGRNGSGQLGFGDEVTRNIPEIVPTLQGLNIIHAAVGRNHSLFVTDTGTVYACGDNKSGQCGIGSTSSCVLIPTRINYNGPPIVRVGCGAEFSIILDFKGNMHSFGLPEYGQLGHNTDGKYFLTSNRKSYHFETVPKQIKFFYEKSKDRHVTPINDVAIVDFSCGNNHTVAIDSNKRAYSWGFGAFGHLGHSQQMDEAVPRLIKYFDSQARGVRSVHCGATYSLAVNENGALFMFGQTKRTGEAKMYPKPVQDLAGWNIRSVGTSNTSIVIAADDSLIAWGVSRTYGELGTGLLQKSTTKPKEVTSMEGLNITQVTMGFSHTLLLCNDATDAVKQKLASMPTFSP